MSYAQRRRFPCSCSGGSAPDCHDGTRHDARASAFPDLVHYASAIARVRCVGADTRVENGEIFTDTRFHVLEAKRALPASIVVRSRAGNSSTYIRTWKAPRNSASERKSTCFSGGAREGSSMCWAGRRNVSRAPRPLSGKETVTQDSAECPSLIRAHAFTKMGVKNLRLDVFQERIRREVLRTLP